MRFSTYAGARPGIGAMLKAVGAPGGNAYGDTMRDLAYVDSARSSAARDESQAALNQQQYGAREGLAGALQGVPLPAGMTPDAIASLYNAGTQSSLGDFADSMGALRGYDAQGLAIDAARRGDNEALNRFSVAGNPGSQYTPYVINDTARYNTATGAGEYTPGHQALVGQRNAAARASDAHAGLYRQQADMERFLPVAPGYTVFEQNPNAGQPAPAPEWKGVPYEVPQPGPIMGALREVGTAPMTPQQQGVGSGGGADGTGKQQRYAELVDQGVPPRVAQGIVDGTLDKITGNMGMVTGYADVTTGQTVATVDNKGMLQLTDYGRQYYGQASAVGGDPPAAQGGPPPGAPTATNPQTGERVYFNGQTWVPY